MNRHLVILCYLLVFLYSPYKFGVRRIDRAIFRAPILCDSFLRGGIVVTLKINSVSSGALDQFDISFLERADPSGWWITGSRTSGGISRRLSSICRADPILPNRVRSYRDGCPAQEMLGDADTPVILVQSDNCPTQMRSELQALGFEVFFGGHGIGANVVPVIAVAESDLTNQEIKSRLAAFSEEWPDAYLFCIHQAARAAPVSYHEVGDTTERLFESGLGHFFKLEGDNVVYHS
jgi:hypothetical protein